MSSGPINAAYTTAIAHDSSQPTTTPDTQPERLPYRQIAAININKLSDLSSQLPSLLTYFATSLSQLTNHPIYTASQQHQPEDKPDDTLASRQYAVRVMTLYVRYSIQVMRGELVRQIEDLERCGVIPASHPRYQTSARRGGQVWDSEEHVRNGGYGDFDVGVLNARAVAGRGVADVEGRLKEVLEVLEREKAKMKGRDDEVGGFDEMMVDG